MSDNPQESSKVVRMTKDIPARAIDGAAVADPEKVQKYSAASYDTAPLRTPAITGVESRRAAVVGVEPTQPQPATANTSAATPEELNKMAAAAYRTATTRAAQPAAPEKAASTNAPAANAPAQTKKE